MIQIAKRVHDNASPNFKWLNSWWGAEDEILSQAYAGPAAGGLIEIGTGTPEQHQRKGYAIVVCARLI
jgi:hypothetical protein